MPFRHFIHPSDKPGSCRLHAYSDPSRPHHRSHVSVSWALPQALASWEIPLLDWPSACPLLAAASCPPGGGSGVPRSRLGLGWPPWGGASAGSTPGCIPREREPVAQGPCPFGPSLSTRFGWSVLTTVQEHVRVPTHSDLAHRHTPSGSGLSCFAPLARPMPPGVRRRHEGG